MQVIPNPLAVVLGKRQIGNYCWSGTHKEEGLMTTPKQDRRVKYTKMVLKQSLLKIMESRPIDKITVKMICEEADVNRSTFYMYYTDPFNLLDQIEGEFFNSIAEAISNEPEIIDNSRILKDIFQTIYDNKELCKVIFSEFGNKTFIRKVVNISYQKSIEEWKKQFADISEKQLGWIFEFVANGSVGVIQTWIHSGMVESPNEVAEFVGNLCMSIVQRYSKQTS
jgi:AcrR family transcriptional regulator